MFYSPHFVAVKDLPFLHFAVVRVRYRPSRVGVMWTRKKPKHHTRSRRHTRTACNDARTAADVQQPGGQAWRKQCGVQRIVERFHKDLASENM